MEKKMFTPEHVDEDGNPCPPPPLPACLKEPRLFDRWRVHPQVFAIPLLTSDVLRFVKNHCPEVTTDSMMEKYNTFMDRFDEFTPEGVNRLAYIVVPLEGRVLWEPLGLVIGTNLDKEDLERTRDEDLIKAVQRAVGVRTQPAWYFYK